MPHLALTTIVVRDYDEAITFYTQSLGFDLVEDTDLGNGKRWVVVRPPHSRESGILLARAATPHQQSRIGDQTGGRVAFFLTTDDFPRDYTRLRAAGIHFEEPPRQEPYGTVAVFQDLYGNRWDLLTPAVTQRR
jgi:catechol 2,3-dioxygenase-like lactoylglutathione lyase family enzyme